MQSTTSRQYRLLSHVRLLINIKSNLWFSNSRAPSWISIARVALSRFWFLQDSAGLRFVVVLICHVGRVFLPPDQRSQKSSIPSVDSARRKFYRVVILASFRDNTGLRPALASWILDQYLNTNFEWFKVSSGTVVSRLHLLLDLFGLGVSFLG